MSQATVKTHEYNYFVAGVCVGVCVQLRQVLISTINKYGTVVLLS